MRGDPEVITLLNEQLTGELTAINQFFLHSKLQESWGYRKLAEQTRDESFGEMRHAEWLTDRIIFLEGLPNYQRLGTLQIGQTVKEQLEADLALERSVAERLRTGIATMREHGDITSARMFEKILEDEEDHIDYLETELGLIEALGEQLYLQHYVGDADQD